MKQRIIFLITIIMLIATGMVWTRFNWLKSSQPDSTVLAEPKSAPLIAAAGRIEPISEEIKVSAEISGKIRSLAVDEGDQIKAGQLLATLENSDYRAQVDYASAQLREREAEMRRVINGARQQERQEAFASVTENQAVLENARTELNRRQSLYQSGVIAREEVDRAAKEFEVAKARFEAARQHHAIIDDQAREEDRAKAEAAVALAQAQLAEAQSKLEKTFIRAPISGVVLRKHLRAGESVITSLPIVTVADTAILRVRADVDETDIGKIRLGQRAYITADAYGNKKFYGKVVRIGQMLGKKNIRTDEPAEKIDNKILETLIELDENQSLPMGLRVNTYIEVGE